MATRQNEAGEWMVTWNGGEITWEEAKRREKEAEELSKGINLLTTQERHWYEDSWTETVVDYFGLARLIDKIRGEKQ